MATIGIEDLSPARTTMRRAFIPATCILMAFSITAKAQTFTDEQPHAIAHVFIPGALAPSERLLRLAANYSCSPRKTCSKTIRSCEEAVWLYQNCSWGGRLDGDNDGIPCENLC